MSCLGAILAGVSIPLSRPFVELWTHGTVEADMPLILCFLAGILLSGPGRASLMLLRYTNNATAVAWSSGLYAFAGLALALPLAKIFGGFGVALAFAITETVAIGLYPPLLVSRLFGFGAARHLAQSYLAGAIAFAVSYGVASVLFAAGEGPVTLALRLRAVGRDRAAAGAPPHPAARPDAPAAADLTRELGSFGKNDAEPSPRSAPRFRSVYRLRRRRDCF